MENTSLSIVIGVVSGTLTSALILLAVNVFNKIIVPWYQAVIYNGVVISGSWHWYDKDNDCVKIELEQFAGEISGIYTYMNSSQDGETKNYKVDGRIRDRFVQLNLTSIDPKRLGIISYIFEIVGDGNELRGCSVFYSTNLNRICADTESFYRTLDLAKANLNKEDKVCATGGDESMQPTTNTSVA